MFCGSEAADVYQLYGKRRTFRVNQIHNLMLFTLSFPCVCICAQRVASACKSFITMWPPFRRCANNLPPHIIIVICYAICIWGHCVCESVVYTIYARVESVVECQSCMISYAHWRAAVDVVHFATVCGVVYKRRRQQQPHQQRSTESRTSAHKPSTRWLGFGSEKFRLYVRLLCTQKGSTVKILFWKLPNIFESFETCLKHVDGYVWIWG